MGVHVPEAGDEVFALGVDDLSGFGVEFGGWSDRGDAVAVDDYGSVGLGLSSDGVDDRSVSDGEGLRVGVEGDDGEGKKEVMEDSHRLMVLVRVRVEESSRWRSEQQL